MTTEPAAAPHPTLVGPVGEHLPGVLAGLRPSSVAIVVDDNTARHCLPRAREAAPKWLGRAPVIRIPAGEATKTLETARQVWQALVDARADRHAVLVNLGGGVVTDLGGFAASCYKRGVRFVHVPTTVLGQVDAALGGKTGVDFAGVKNVVGTFRMPAAVVADPTFLTTLPPREVRSGVAEMYKHALIADADHWSELRAAAPALLGHPREAELLARSQAIKLNVVAADPHERGAREALNFGHSVGHAIESVLLTSSTPALHGEAIAAGMLCEAYLSRKLTGLGEEALDKITATLLAHYGRLPLRANHLVSLLALVANDKKNRGGQTRMALLRRIGEARVGVGVSDEDVEEAVRWYVGLAAR